MQELIAPVLGFVGGALLFRQAYSVLHLAILAAAVALAAAGVATVVTGEYMVSWLYIISDLGGAAGGVIVALPVVREKIAALVLRLFHAGSAPRR